MFAAAAESPAPIDPIFVSDTRDVVRASLGEEENVTGLFSPVGSPGNRVFTETTFPELFAQSTALSAALAELGVGPGDRVGLFADNRLEWLLADVSVLRNGALDVPRGTDSTAEELRYIVEHSGSRVAFAENEQVLEKLLTTDDSPLETIVLIEGSAGRTQSRGRKILPLQELGRTASPGAVALVRARSGAVRPEDPFTIIYTSGTTGKPKGVELTHANMVYNVNEVPPMIGVRRGERCLSILPIWHVFERALEYGLLPHGAKIYYTSIRHLREDFQTVRPTFMASAPRLWESIYDGIMNQLSQATAERRRVFDLALSVRKRLNRSRAFLAGNELGALPADDPARQAREWARAARDVLPSVALDQIVFRKIRRALGGCLRGTISGGGALPGHVDEFFNAIGIPVYEGYGMTECSPIISVRKRGRVVQGSVGFTPPGTEVRILTDDGRPMPLEQVGVIHVRGPQVMRGYYRDPEATARILSDGWLNTGDLGFLSRNGTLSIRGRAKDTIVLLGGENVEPEPIESRLRENPYIEQVMVVGQDRKTIGALVWPNHILLEKEGLPSRSRSEAWPDDTELRRFFSNIIRAQISPENGFKSFERVTTFAFLPRAFEVGSELTNLYKLKRNVIASTYAELIESMYVGGRSAASAGRATTASR